MIKVYGTQKHHRVIGQIPIRKRKLIESRCDLTNLIYWMEHDRSLDAQPDKVILLRKLLGDLESRIDNIHPGTN